VGDRGAQWQFWAVPAKDFDARSRSQYSITLNSLKKLAGSPVDFRGLRDAVDRAAARKHKRGFADTASRCGFADN